MFDIDDNNFITLQDEEGREVDFLLLDVIEYEGHDYMALLPLSDEEDEDTEEEIFFLRADTTEEGEVYTTIDSPETYEAVAAAFETYMREMAAQAEQAESDEE